MMFRRDSPRTVPLQTGHTNSCVARIPCQCKRPIMPDVDTVVRLRTTYDADNYHSCMMTMNSCCCTTCSSLLEHNLPLAYILLAQLHDSPINLDPTEYGMLTSHIVSGNIRADMPLGVANPWGLPPETMSLTRALQINNTWLCGQLLRDHYIPVRTYGVNEFFFRLAEQLVSLPCIGEEPKLLFSERKLGWLEFRSYPLGAVAMLHYGAKLEINPRILSVDCRHLLTQTKDAQAVLSITSLSASIGISNASANSHYIQLINTDGPARRPLPRYGIEEPVEVACIWSAFAHCSLTKILTADDASLPTCLATATSELIRVAAADSTCWLSVLPRDILHCVLAPLVFRAVCGGEHYGAFLLFHELRHSGFDNRWWDECWRNAFPPNKQAPDARIHDPDAPLAYIKRANALEAGHCLGCVDNDLSQQRAKASLGWGPFCSLLCGQTYVTQRFSDLKQSDPEQFNKIMKFVDVC